MKLLKNDDIILPFIYSLIGLFYWLGKNKLSFAVNYKYEETDCKNSVKLGVYDLKKGLEQLDYRPAP